MRGERLLFHGCSIVWWLAAVLLLSVMRSSAQSNGAEMSTIYSADTNHLWNRLNQTLFERIPGYGLDELDILYWSRTKHLLSGASHQAALSILDEFINGHGEKLISNPVKRALLQRDLWELFDWTAMPFPSGQTEFADARQELESRLAVVIRRLALTTNEIALLPDNYVQAERDGLPGLPRDIFNTNGDWVSVGVGGVITTPVTPEHTYGFHGHSAFSVMLHLPGGRTAALEYLEHLRTFTPSLNSHIPEFPTNTEWALVRRMCVIDAERQIQATRLTESLQLRRYLQIKATVNPDSNIMQVAEFQMDKRHNGGLRAVRKDERQFGFAHFGGVGFEPFESSADFKSFHMQVLATCFACHNSPGISSVQSYTGAFRIIPLSDRPVKLAPVDGGREAAATIYWKRQQFDWGLLQGLWINTN